MELKRVREIIDEYPGEWVAVEVVEYAIPSDVSGDKDFGKLVSALGQTSARSREAAIRGHTNH